MILKINTLVNEVTLAYVYRMNIFMLMLILQIFFFLTKLNTENINGLSALIQKLRQFCVFYNFGTQNWMFYLLVGQPSTKLWQYCKPVATKEQYTPGQNDVIHPVLVERDKILLTPLHMKLGLMKNFPKLMNKERWFQYL